MNPFDVLRAGWGLAVFAGWIAPAMAATNQFVEDFSTTTFRDATKTTSDWNTAAGDLRLPPLSPMPAGSYDTPGLALDVFVAGDYAYVADETAGLQVFHVSLPRAPAPAGCLDTPGRARQVLVSGGYAYVADDAAGLQVIDVRDPSRPTLAGSYDTPGLAHAVAVSGDYAFVADGAAGLQVIDVSDPTAPTLAGSYDTPGFAHDVDISGNHTFVADSGGLLVVDIRDPQSPTPAGFYDTPRRAVGVSVSGDHAFVADELFGLQVIDVQNPNAPKLTGGYDTPGLARSVCVAGDQAFLAADFAGLWVIDVTDPATPAPAGNYDPPDPGTSWGVFVAGDHAFVASGLSGLQVIDVAETLFEWPSLPLLAGSIPSSGTPGKIVVSGDYAYWASGTAGLQVVDIRDPGSPRIVATAAAGNVVDVAVNGDHAFVLDFNHPSQGFKSVSIRDPTKPIVASSAFLTHRPRALALHGNHAYVIDDAEFLWRIDISNPAAPRSEEIRTAIANSNTTSYHDIAVAGDFMYIANGDHGLVVWDISDPFLETTGTSPATVVSLPGIATSIAIDGHVAYVALLDSDIPPFGLLLAVDIREPRNARTGALGGFTSGGDFTGVVVDGNFAFLTGLGNPFGDDTAGLSVADLSCGIAEIDFVPTNRPAALAVAGEMAYVADDDGLSAWLVFQRRFDRTTRTAQSRRLETGDDAIPSVKLAVTQTPGVTWEVTTNGGIDWTAITPGAFQNLPAGTDLRWRATHSWTQFPGPSVDELKLEWLHEFAPINYVTDVPGDQGGWVRLNLTRSGYDSVNETKTPATGYQIYRRVDQTYLLAAASGDRLPGAMAASLALPLAGLDSKSMRHIGERTFVLGAPPFPPGTWEIVATVFATQSDHYEAIVPTTADSSAGELPWSVYLVTTHTTEPAVWFVSAPDSGYSVGNLAPSAPQNLMAQSADEAGVLLSWSAVGDADLSHYAVYRDVASGVAPSVSNRIALAFRNSFVDASVEPHRTYYYVVTAVDFAGNESDISNEAMFRVTVSDAINFPIRFALRPSHPNPFNPQTTIGFDLVHSALVQLRIYDMRGTLVRTLANRWMPRGRHAAVWDGTDDHGRRVSSGSYVHRFVAGDYRESRKVTLVK